MSLQKDIDEHKSDIQKLHGEQNKLQGIIKSLEKDIYGLKKEIQERDETIQDKVRSNPFRALPLGHWSFTLLNNSGKQFNVSGIWCDIKMVLFSI